MKLLFFRCCTVLFLLLSFCISAVANRTGDVNGDGTVTSSDARLALRTAVKLEFPQGTALDAADVNADGIITASDARMILRECVQLERFSGGLTVSFIDVGQADSILIECNDKTMLIDGGNTDDSGTVCSFLTAKGISELDYAINSHADEDHVGGLASVINTYSVSEKIIISPLSATTSCYQSFISACAKRFETPQTLSVGTVFSLGNSTVTVLGPIQSDTTDRNESSVVLRLCYGNTSFLFTGDAGTESETKMLQNGENVSAMVLKVGHHGSRSSSGSTFLTAVGAEFGIISCGTGNSYGHPHTETLQRLANAGITVFRTDTQGTITVISNGKTCAFYTDKNETLITTDITYEAEYIGNISSKIFHRPSCSSLPAQKNRIIFASRNDAVSAGYNPCGRCKP